MLTRERGAIDPIRANSEVHELLRKGAGVEVRGKDGERNDRDRSRHRLGQPGSE